MVTEPYDYEGKFMVEQTYPIMIDGKFAGVAGVDRALDQLTKDLEAIKVRQKEAGWNIDIILVSRLGSVIASTVDGVDMKTKKIGATEYADVLQQFHDGSTGPAITTDLLSDTDPLSKEQCFYAAKEIPTGSWTVVMELPRKDVIAKITGPLLFTLAVAIIGFSTVLGLIYWLTASLTRRIEQSAHAAQRVAEGDLTGAALEETAISCTDESGQLLAGSLMDYALPRADHFPGFAIDMRNTPCANNLLGIKGAGEAGAIGAPQAVISAVCDALQITHIDMPATPLEIFNVINAKQTQKTLNEEASG